MQQFADLVHDLQQHLAPEGSAVNPFLVDNFYPELVCSVPMIDLTQIDNITSSISGLSGKSAPRPFAVVYLLTPWRYSIATRIA